MPKTPPDFEPIVLHKDEILAVTFNVNFDDEGITSIRRRVKRVRRK